jgi:hypothetical protein
MILLTLLLTAQMFTVGAVVRYVLRYLSRRSLSFAILLQATDIPLIVTLAALIPVISIINFDFDPFLYTPPLGLVTGYLLLEPVVRSHELYRIRWRDQEFEILSVVEDHGELELKSIENNFERWSCPQCHKQFRVRPRPKDRDATFVYKIGDTSYIHTLSKAYLILDDAVAYRLLKTLDKGGFGDLIHKTLDED